MILVTGATGLVGGHLVKELLARSAGPVRAMYRDEKDAKSIPADVQGVRADFTDADSLAKALQGVESAYLVCAAVPQLVDLETAFLNACVKAGVGHVVIQSAMGAGNFPKSFPSWHYEIERRAVQMGLPVTILRPNGFMQIIASYNAGTIRAQGAFYDALGTQAISLIDVRDIAAAAAAVLQSPKTIGQTFELNGPEAIGNTELARRISWILGRPVKYVPLTSEQMLRGMVDAGMPQERAKPVVDLYELYQAGGGVGSDAALRSLIGREPRRIDAYLRENAGEFSPSGFSPEQAKAFVRDHFEQFVNGKNVGIGKVNFAADFIDHGADVPPGTPPGPEGAMAYVGNALKMFPDLHVTIDDIVAEGDRVVVRNTWTATEPQHQRRIAFRGIVIWRIADRRLAERWAFLEPPKPVDAN